MKNGLLIWNVILTIGIGYLLFAHLGGKKTTEKTMSKITGKDSTLSGGNFRIAYFEMDSVENNFHVVKAAKAEITRKEDDINSEMNSLAKNLQQRYNYFQTQAQAGGLSQAQSEEASLELKTMDEKMKNRKQTLDQEYNEFVTLRMNKIKTNIEDFLKVYNKDRQFSYIIAYEQGLFYYKDSAYNITGDVIKGLNEMYKSKKE
ncbi:MAG: OmpH family outer membrane protein [Chitinophagaceae bacterium]|nr:OmpH family outer membrane protein [Chitinophagaceae bacterium]